MEKLNILQIGICHEHAAGKFSSLKKLPDVFNLIGYVDERDFCRTPRLGEPKPEIYAGFRKFSLEEALAQPGIDAVTVEVPNNDLVPIALKCMERGLPMHMDKPGGEDLALYRKLLDGCKAKNLPFQMGYMFRGNPAFRFAIRAVREKLLGDVFEIEANMNHCYGGEAYQDYLAKFPGGIMYNLGCHLIDFAVAAMGCPEAVTPFLRSAPGYPDGFKTNCMTVLEYPHAFVTLRACCKDGTAEKESTRRMYIAGTCGTLAFSPLERFDGKPIEIELCLKTDTPSFPAGKHTLRFPPLTDRYDVQLLELADVIRKKRKPTYSYEHDYLVHKITLAAAGYIKWR